MSNTNTTYTGVSVSLSFPIISKSTLYFPSVVLSAVTVFFTSIFSSVDFDVTLIVPSFVISPFSVISKVTYSVTMLYSFGAVLSTILYECPESKYIDSV